MNSRPINKARSQKLYGTGREEDGVGEFLQRRSTAKVPKLSQTACLRIATGIDGKGRRCCSLELVPVRVVSVASQAVQGIGDLVPSCST